MDNKDQKQEKPDLLRRMASVTSHEIRNPLAIISNSLYFIKTKLGAGGAALDPKIAKHIGIIEGEVKRSNEVLEEILAFTRAKEMHPAPASVNSAIKDLTGAYVFPPSVTVKSVPDPADPCVNADMEAVGCALRHILDNSVQAMPEGGTVTIEASHDAKRALLTVTDSGPGLPDGDGAASQRPAGNFVQPAFNITLMVDSPSTTGDKSTVTIHDVKINNWSYTLPEDDFVVEAAAFQALYITVEDETQ